VTIGRELLAHPELARLARVLAARPGARAENDGDPRRAAVALVLRSDAADQLELLLIKRSERDDDPWSGHIALPGGRHDPTDASLQDTAIRETREETSIDIARDGVIFGTLDELRPRTPHLPSIIVTPFVSVVRAGVSLELSEEVAAAFWVPLASLTDPRMAGESTVVVRGESRQVASYTVGQYVVWGMTERILHQFIEYLAPADGA
jgi:8-oxo-dGTP pyrophosphatase MutT (NUDIX family)